ncbi:MAG: hypothetical protein KC451_06955 [Amylibacter sp.]|nr:hypothetical protein [Amylibacter sp.]
MNILQSEAKLKVKYLKKSVERLLLTLEDENEDAFPSALALLEVFSFTRPYLDCAVERMRKVDALDREDQWMLNAFDLLNRDDLFLQAFELILSNPKLSVGDSYAVSCSYFYRGNRTADSDCFSLEKYSQIARRCLPEDVITKIVKQLKASNVISLVKDTKR